VTAAGNWATSTRTHQHWRIMQHMLHKHSRPLRTTTQFYYIHK